MTRTLHSEYMCVCMRNIICCCSTIDTESISESVLDVFTFHPVERLELLHSVQVSFQNNFRIYIRYLREELWHLGLCSNLHVF